MAYIYVDPTAAGDASFLLANRECYSTLLGNSDVTPNITSATSMDNCHSCVAPLCSACGTFCFSSDAVATMTWSWDDPAGYGTTWSDACDDAWDQLVSGSATLPLTSVVDNIASFGGSMSSGPLPYVLAQFDCSASVWYIAIYGDPEGDAGEIAACPTCGCGDVSGVEYSGDGCGATGTTAVLAAPPFVGPPGSCGCAVLTGSISIEVTYNGCCNNGSECVDGTPECDGWCG